MKWNQQNARLDLNMLLGWLYWKLYRALVRQILEYVSSVWNPQQQPYYLEDDVSPVWCVWRMAISTMIHEVPMEDLYWELGLEVLETRRRDLVVCCPPCSVGSKRKIGLSCHPSPDHFQSYLHPTVEQVNYLPHVTTALCNDPPANSLAYSCNIECGEPPSQTSIIASICIMSVQLSMFWPCLWHWEHRIFNYLNNTLPLYSMVIRYTV